MKHASAADEAWTSVHFRKPLLVLSPPFPAYARSPSQRCLDADQEVVTDRVVNWLILPVVICLSQRLSHACLSINNFILWNCERLIISAIIYLMVPYYMDNCGNSRANTCVRPGLLRERAYLLDKKPMRSSGTVVWWFIITFRIARPCAGDSSFKFLPYQLSTVV